MLAAETLLPTTSWGSTQHHIRKYEPARPDKYVCITMNAWTGSGMAQFKHSSMLRRRECLTLYFNSTPEHVHISNCCPCLLVHNGLQHGYPQAPRPAHTCVAATPRSHQAPLVVQSLSAKQVEPILSGIGTDFPDTVPLSVHMSTDSLLMMVPFAPLIGTLQPVGHCPAIVHSIPTRHGSHRQQSSHCIWTGLHNHPTFFDTVNSYSLLAGWPTLACLPLLGMYACHVGMRQQQAAAQRLSNRGTCSMLAHMY